MEKLPSRLFVYDTDLVRVRLLVDRNGIRPNIPDICEILEIHQTQENCRVWLDLNGDLKAIALVDGYQNLWFDAAGDVEINELLQEILPWAMETAGRLFNEPALDACEYADSSRLSHLLNLGFTETGLRTLKYAYYPSIKPPENLLPDGFKVRPLLGMREVPAWLELHRKAHSESHLDEDYRKAMMAAPSYDPSMDFVLESPGGTLVAYCVCTLERSSDGVQIGSTDPVAVDPEYYGRGFGKAILRYSINHLVGRGASLVELGTSSENLAMQRLAESVGFRRVEEKIWLRLEK